LGQLTQPSKYEPWIAVAHDGNTVTEAHAQILAHLGVKTGHTAKQVRTLAKKIHNLM
jgi:hypothetical protein